MSSDQPVCKYCGESKEVMLTTGFCNEVHQKLYEKRGTKNVPLLKKVRDLKESNWSWLAYEFLGYRVTDDEESNKAFQDFINEIVIKSLENDVVGATREFNQWLWSILESGNPMVNADDVHKKFVEVFGE